MVRLEEISVNDIIGVSEDEKTYGVGTQSQVLRFVRQYPEGVTAQMVAEFMKISQNRAREVLKELVLKREIYHRKISGKIFFVEPSKKTKQICLGKCAPSHLLSKFAGFV